MGSYIFQKLHRKRHLLADVANLKTSRSDLHRFWQTSKSHFVNIKRHSIQFYGFQDQWCLYMSLRKKDKSSPVLRASFPLSKFLLEPEWMKKAVNTFQIEYIKIYLAFALFIFVQYNKFKLPLNTATGLLNMCMNECMENSGIFNAMKRQWGFASWQVGKWSRCTV